MVGPRDGNELPIGMEMMKGLLISSLVGLLALIGVIGKSAMEEIDQRSRAGAYGADVARELAEFAMREGRLPGGDEFLRLESAESGYFRYSNQSVHGEIAKGVDRRFICWSDRCGAKRILIYNDFSVVTVRADAVDWREKTHRP